MSVLLLLSIFIIIHTKISFNSFKKAIVTAKLITIPNYKFVMVLSLLSVKIYIFLVLIFEQ